MLEIQGDEIPDTGEADFRERIEESSDLPATLESAEKGDADAQALLAFFHSTGEGVTKEPVQAARWYRLAAEQGNAPSQYALGICYATGEGVGKDVPEAAKWYRRAAEQGLAPAQTNLAYLYSKGEGVPKDMESAIAA